MSDHPVKLILVDDDSLWLLGLRTALTDVDNLPNNLQNNLQIIAEAARVDELIDLELISVPDVLLLGMNGHYLDQLWQPCQQLQQRFPSLHILFLSIPLTLEELTQARDRGIKGYCLRTEAIATILTAVHQVSQGKSFWSAGVSLPQENLIPPANATFLSHQATTGVNQINRELEKINVYLQQSNLSNFHWFFWTGRKRELLTARWLINQLLPIHLTNFSTTIPASEPTPARDNSNSYPPNFSNLILFSETNNDFINQSIVPSGIGMKVYELVQLQLGTSLVNLTGNSLEIDILSLRKKQDLLSLVLKQFITLCQDLSLSQVNHEYIIAKKQQLIQDLWTTTVTDFFGKYSRLRVGLEEQEITSTLLLDAATIQGEILDKIPFVEELLSQILFETNLTIDYTSYPGDSGEAIARAELILENLIIQVANAVIQPLLNRFSEVETIKLAFYDQKLISARDITKFRNNLSWKYRLSNYFHEPKLIFESCYQLHIFNESSIRKISVCAPRTQELQSLTGLRYFVTLWLELKDAIAPRLQTLTSFLGRGLIYVLTQIIGRGIGLVGKGILQGIGNSLQDARVSKDGRK